MLLSEMAPMVWPSFGAFFSASMAMRPPAPGRLATMTFCPVAFCRPCPIARTMTSSPSPGAPAVMSVIGLDGQPCAAAAEHQSATPSSMNFLINMSPSSLNADDDFAQLAIGVHVLGRRLHFLERENPVDDRPDFALRDRGHQVLGEAPRGLRALLGGAQAIADAEKMQPAHGKGIHVELDFRRAAHLPDGRVTAIDGERIQDLVEERPANSIDADVRALPVRRLLHPAVDIPRRRMDPPIKACGLELGELFG